MATLQTLIIVMSFVQSVISSKDVKNLTVNQCMFKDNENIYDFERLSNNNVWEYLPDENDTQTKITLHFSVCKPLTETPSFCNGTDIGFCVYRTVNGTVDNGFIAMASMSKMPANETFFNHGLYISYDFINGIKCGVLTDTRITIFFVCQRKLKRRLIKMSLTRSCDPFVIWETEAACPKQIVRKDAHKCIIRFSNSEDDLNLHHLHSSTYYNVSNQYVINICGPIHDYPCGDENTTVCDIRHPEKPVAIATNENTTLTWDDGILSLVYIGNDNFNVYLDIVCLKNLHDPFVIVKAHGFYGLRFRIFTSAVCTPIYPKCVIRDRKGIYYDLRDLRRSSENWRVDTNLRVSISVLDFIILHEFMNDVSC